MKGIRLGNNGFAWLLLLPSLAILALFTFYPIFLTLRLSFFQADLATPEPIFAGLDNFRRLAEDEVFWKVMRNNTLFAVGTVPAGIGLALLMAVFSNKAIRGKALMRTGFFLPDTDSDDCGCEHLAVHLHAGIRPGEQAVVLDGGGPN